MVKSSPNAYALDPARVEAIADAIHTACSGTRAYDQERDDAKSALTDASDKAINAREAIMVALANLSVQGQWTDQEIRHCAAVAAGRSNNKSDKALATFIGETKRAMDPKVRSYVPDLVALRDKVWDDEAMLHAADKDMPTPCKKAFVRKYHMMITMFGECADGWLFTTPDQVVRYAVAHDPDWNAEKVAKKVAQLKTMIDEIYSRFSDAPLQVASQALDDVSKLTLDASRRQDNVETPEVVQTAPIITAPTPPTVVAQDTGPAEGAYDIDAYLDGRDQLLVAA